MNNSIRLIPAVKKQEFQVDMMLPFHDIKMSLVQHELGYSLWSMDEAYAQSKGLFRTIISQLHCKNIFSTKIVPYKNLIKKEIELGKNYIDERYVLVDVNTGKFYNKDSFLLTFDDIVVASMFTYSDAVKEILSLKKSQPDDTVVAGLDILRLDDLTKSSINRDLLFDSYNKNFYIKDEDTGLFFKRDENGVTERPKDWSTQTVTATPFSKVEAITLMETMLSIYPDFDLKLVSVTK